MIWKLCTSVFPCNIIDAQPSILLLSYSNGCLTRDFVKISLSFSVVSIRVTHIIPHVTDYRKRWYFIPTCFVLGLYLGTLANSFAPFLSSKSVQWIPKDALGMSNIDLNPKINSLRGNTSLAAVLNAMHSSSVVEKDISICNLLKQVNGTSCIFDYVSCSEFNRVSIFTSFSGTCPCKVCIDISFEFS